MEDIEKKLDLTATPLLNSQLSVVSTTGIGFVWIEGQGLCEVQLAIVSDKNEFISPWNEEDPIPELIKEYERPKTEDAKKCIR